jgi:hypothetical protein
MAEGQGAIQGRLHASGRIAEQPCRGGRALEVYGNDLIDGGVIPPQVAIGGRMAEVLFSARLPDTPA